MRSDLRIVPSEETPRANAAREQDRLDDDWLPDDLALLAVQLRCDAKQLENDCPAPIPRRIVERPAFTGRRIAAAVAMSVLVAAGLIGAALCIAVKVSWPSIAREETARDETARQHANPNLDPKAAPAPPSSANEVARTNLNPSSGRTGPPTFDPTNAAAVKAPPRRSLASLTSPELEGAIDLMEAGEETDLEALSTSISF